MAALPPGKKAPAISLNTIDGQKMSLDAALHSGPVLLAFFKISCPTCQYTLPFLQRIFESYRKGPISIWGISQNDREDTIDFCQHFGVTFPVLLDDARFTVSNAYAITNVPTLFFVGSDGTIELTSVGFAKSDIEALAQKASQKTNIPLMPPFRPGEVIPAFKHG
ncbi:MAG TPA: TlpA disulfide reductase family protein [Candidatus Acidoferrum sp.]|nr:TlpA disulfide reductase family protein [Candidatus Acidoferrum sp.]